VHGGLAIFYEDAFDDGGAPVGLQHLVRSLSEHVPVYLYGKASDALPDLGRGVRREYRSLAALPGRLRSWLRSDRPDVLLVVGFFLPHNPVAVAVGRREGIPTALHPMSQISDTMFTDRVFTHGCDVTDLEQRSVNAERVRDRVAAKASPLAKRAFCATAGRYMITRSSASAVLSTEEARQLRKRYPQHPHPTVELPWGTDSESIPPEASTHFYRDVLGLTDDRANLVVWSRLDYRFKGLDRVLDGARAALDRCGGESPFRLFLCGPDYRGGSGEARAHIERLGLDQVAHVLGPGDYPPGGKSPLRDATATVLLSRWDGSPRTLREAAHFGTPMIVTEETNFADLVRRHGCGTVVDGDDADAVGLALLEMTDPAVRAGFADGAEALARASGWETIGLRFVEDAARLEPTEDG
jgi:glycosyltransferase involved in cell wall biosynthesis